MYICIYIYIYIYIRSEFIHWPLWRTLMRTEYFLFVHHTTSILAKLSTWCFEHSGDISCSLLVNPSYTEESWEGRNTCMYIYIYMYGLGHIQNSYSPSLDDIYIYHIYIYIYIYIYIDR